MLFFSLFGFFGKYLNSASLSELISWYPKILMNLIKSSFVHPSKFIIFASSLNLKFLDLEIISRNNLSRISTLIINLPKVSNPQILKNLSSLFLKFFKNLIQNLDNPYLSYN